jgi:cyclase
MRVRLFAILALAACLARPAEAQSKLKVEKLADGVWAAAPAKGANVGWFLLGDGVVAVDGGGDAAIGAEILKSIAETTGGRPVRILVITHAHADHSGGARVFAAAGARIVCQEAAAGQILGSLISSATGAADPAGGGPGARPVVESISERAILVDGIHNAQIYFLGAAHTKGDLVVYLPNDKILYAGDLASNGFMPVLQSSDVDPTGWERALQTLSKVPIEKLVPGHGDIGPTAGIRDSLAYVQAVNHLAKKLVDSGAPDSVLEVQVRATENLIKNVPLTDQHVANVMAAVRVEREKAVRKTTPTPAPAGK